MSLKIGKILRFAFLIGTIHCATFQAFSQRPKLGVVLSGGGASGLAHIGFLRALEENHIPIDYISGTSMGALVGGLYASGYTTQEIEDIFKSQEFKVWSSGQIDDRYQHYFKKRQDDASWVRIKFSLDSILESNLPTNLINSTALDFGLTELFNGPSAVGEYNFDSLMIPFRCVASDIVQKKPYVFKDGDLSNAIRASISYPFFLSPVSYKDMLLYDGGLYDNFPVGTLCKSFEPDYIVGCNVSFNFPKPDEDNVLSQLRSMMSENTDYKIECEKGFIVEPPVTDMGILEFKNVELAVAEGYEATILKIDSIKSYYPFRQSLEELNQKRIKFRKDFPKPIISKIEVLGLSNAETKYVLNSIRFKPTDSLDFSDMKSRIMKLASDERIKRIRPELIYDQETKSYKLKLHIKPEKKMFVSFGGNISSKAINEGFIGIQYNQLSFTPVTLYGNGYFGKFYSSGFGLIKIDVPARIPFELNASYTISKWDYFQNSNILLEGTSPSYMVYRDNFGEVGLAFPISYKGKLNIGLGYGDIKYEYYQDNDFNRYDTADISDFINTSAYIKYESNSLNRKQYANAGSLFSIKATYINGNEKTMPGSAAIDDTIREAHREWGMIRFKLDRYFNKRHLFKFGVLLEGVYSEQPFFSNYAASILAAPSFEPIPESKTVFRSKFRAYQWGAAGLKTILTPVKNLDFRLEGFMFQPWRQINADGDLKAYYDATAVNRYFVGSFTIVYTLAFTQIAVNLNYYDNFNENFPANNNENYTVMLHLGFILFNDKMLD